MNDRLGMGANNPPTALDVFGPRLNRLLLDLTALTAQPVTERVAAQLRDVVKRAIDLDKELTAAKSSDKQPHLDANVRIEADYRPLVDDAARIKTEARKRIDAFLFEEEQRRQREAAQARALADEEARIAAQARANAQETPFGATDADDATHDAAMADIRATHAERRAEAGPAVGSASGLGRATSLRSYWSVKVTDPVAAATHFANDPGVKIAVKKAADAFARTTKGTQPIPGCQPIEERRSA